jgi:hypothetical protein
MGLIETVYLLLQLPRFILLLRIYERPSSSLWGKKKDYTFNIPPSANSRSQQLIVTQQTKKFLEAAGSSRTHIYKTPPLLLLS